jgi:hypothetical protein
MVRASRWSNIADADANQRSASVAVVVCLEQYCGDISARPRCGLQGGLRRGGLGFSRRLVGQRTMEGARVFARRV